MGKRGPKPTPTPILKARGSWRADGRADAGGPLFPVEAPVCPAWLGVEAKAEWKRVVKYLLDAGLLAKVNRATLTAYCDAWGRYVVAVWKLEETGGSVLRAKATGGLYQNPWLAIVRNERADAIRLAAEFGMTQASAGKVTPAMPEQQDEPDGKGRFFKVMG